MAKSINFNKGMYLLAFISDAWESVVIKLSVYEKRCDEEKIKTWLLSGERQPQKGEKKKHSRFRSEQEHPIENCCNGGR